MLLDSVDLPKIPRSRVCSSLIVVSPVGGLFGKEFTKASGDQVDVESWGIDQIEYDRKGHMSSSSYSSFQVGTSVANGMIENYNDLSSMSDSVQLDQSGHIIVLSDLARDEDFLRGHVAQLLVMTLM